VIPRPPTDREVGIVGTLLPSTTLDRATVIPSGSHDVVLIPDIAAVRIARDALAVESLPRRTALLEALAKAELPIATPIPLSPVVVHVRLDRCRRVMDPRPLRTTGRR
jgi:hypothetical protein